MGDELTEIQGNFCLHLRRNKSYRRLMTMMVLTGTNDELQRHWHDSLDKLSIILSQWIYHYPFRSTYCSIWNFTRQVRKYILSFFREKSDLLMDPWHWTKDSAVDIIKNSDQILLFVESFKNYTRMLHFASCKMKISPFILQCCRSVHSTLGKI